MDIKEALKLVGEQICETIRTLVPGDIRPNMELEADLGLDSFLRLDVSVGLEDILRRDFSNEESELIKSATTVQQLAEAVVNLPERIPA
ncbi:acyl carrier protein [Patescibacteria group bacterium]